MRGVLWTPDIRARARVSAPEPYQCGCTVSLSAAAAIRLKGRQNRMQRRSVVAVAAGPASFRTQRSPFWGPFRASDVASATAARAAAAAAEGNSPPHGPAGNEASYATFLGSARPAASTLLRTETAYLAPGSSVVQQLPVPMPVAAAARHALARQQRRQRGDPDTLAAALPSKWPRPERASFRATMIPAGDALAIPVPPAPPPVLLQRRSSAPPAEQPDEMDTDPDAALVVATDADGDEADTGVGGGNGDGDGEPDRVCAQCGGAMAVTAAAAGDVCAACGASDIAADDIVVAQLPDRPDDDAVTVEMFPGERPADRVDLAVE